MTATHLPALNGCERPLVGGRVLVVLGDVSFDECPARFTDAVAEEIVDLALTRALAHVTPLDRLAMPAGLVDAVEWVTSILPAAAENPDAS